MPELLLDRTRGGVYLVSPGERKGTTMRRFDTLVVLCLGLAVIAGGGCSRPSKHLTLGLGKGVTMKLVRIPAGTFLMGSPDNERGRSDGDGPQRHVVITRPFYMSIHEVTQEQYEAATGGNPSHFRRGSTDPVDGVSWDDAVTFCETLSRGMTKTIRLPTEVEWEYACRAGTRTAYSWGNSWKQGVCNAENHPKGRNNNVPEFRRRGLPVDSTMPVGTFKPNAWGLYDMHGNLWEWCSDWKGSYADADTRDPEGPSSGEYRVLRGGAWICVPRGCRSSCRYGLPGEWGYDFVGFRVVVEIDRTD